MVLHPHIIMNVEYNYVPLLLGPYTYHESAHALYAWPAVYDCMYMQNLSANKHQISTKQYNATHGDQTSNNLHMHLLCYIGHSTAFVHNKSSHSREVDKVAVQVWCSCLCPSNNCQLERGYMHINGSFVVSIYADFHWLRVMWPCSTYICGYIQYIIISACFLTYKYI